MLLERIINLCFDVDLFYDERDGNSYTVLILGKMQWLGENLREDVCPNGWHLPTDEEWKELDHELMRGRN